MYWYELVLFDKNGYVLERRVENELWTKVILRCIADPFAILAIPVE